MINVIRIKSLARKALHGRRKIVFGSMCVLVLAILSASVYAAMNNGHATEVPSNQEMASEEEGMYSTVHPTLISDSSSALILGTVISHETANIYPRRDGIVEDIYVDIGDTVKKGQVVALLLPKGVEGQSAALIAEKKARMQQAESDLSTAEQVAEETVISARQKIQEKETELMIAQREQNEMLQKFAEYEDNIVQLRDQAFITVQNSRQTVESIVMGSNSRTRDNIQEHEMLEDVGRLSSNSMDRVYLVAAFNDLLKMESDYMSTDNRGRSDMIDSLIAQALTMLNQTTMLLQTTATSPNDHRGFRSFSYEELSGHVDKIASTTDAVLKAQEKIEDAINSFASLRASEPELYAAYFSGDSTDRKSNKVHMLESQIATAHNSLALTEANQEQMVESRRSHVEIANAMLQSEYAQSGHRQIRSPFSGTVSKRFIDVGQIVMPSMSAFELTDVPTSLAKKAKAEIQFGLPEHLIEAVDVGDTVAFFLQTDETKEYEAEVTRKSPQVDMKTHTITVQAKIPDDLNLPHQTSIRIRLKDEKTPVYRVPSSAVKREEDRNLLWIVDPETDEPTQIDVSVVAEDGEFAELTGNVSEVSQIILDPPDLFLMQDQQ